jgi:Cupredoxin-like domain
MKLKFIAVITLCLIFFTSCQKNEPAKQETPKVEIQKTDEKSAVKVEFKTNPAEVKKDEQTELSFTVKNGNGEIIKDLKIVHEKPMHLLVVSADLSEFYHLHPEPQPDGSYKAPFAFAGGGKYKLYADFTTQDDKQTVSPFDLDVKGEVPPTVKLVPDAKFEQMIGGIRVEMKPDGEIIARKEMLLNFYVTDILSKKPAEDLQNYLGEKAHFVVISQDLQEFVHAHPISNNTDGEHNHGDMNMKTPEKTDATVSAHISFPKPGIYKLWAQFQRNGRVIDVPFAVNVAEVSKAASEETPKGVYKVIVNKDGFMPNEIKIKAGDFKQLGFLRIDDNCAEEIVFPTLNIKKKLPLNELTLIDLPKNFNGELNFACGKNMMKGKLIVQ